MLKPISKAFGAILTLTSAALANDCDGALATASTTLLNSNESSLGAWWNIVNQENYAAVRQNANARYKEVVFSADYNTAQQRKSAYHSAVGYNRTVDESRSELQVRLNETQLNVWRDCKLAEANYFIAETVEADGESATIKLHWRPALGIGRVQDVQVELLGARPNRALRALKRMNPGARSFLIERMTPQSTIKLTVAGTVEGSGPDGSVTANVKVSPPPVAVTPPAAATRREAFAAAANSDLGRVIDVLFRGWAVGAEVDDESEPQQNNMLHIAASRCSEAVVSVLLDAGAPQPRNIHNQRPLDIADHQCGSTANVTTMLRDAL